MGVNSDIDKDQYESTRTYMRDALRHMAATGHKVHDLSEFMLEKFGDEILPYLEQFYRDIRAGRINLRELSHSAREAFFGHPISEQERERRIRETAYLRAEQRGFVGGSDIDDWLYAERTVDAQLAEEAGLIAKGQKGLSSFAHATEDELSDLGEHLAAWMKRKLGGKSQKGRSASTAKKKAAPTKAGGGSVKKAAVKKKAAPKKSAVKRPL